MIRFSCVVDAGIGGHKNDDRALVCRHIISNGFYEETVEIALAVVCDGVGGEAYGGEAAEIAVAHFSAILEQDFTVDSIRSSINDINSVIIWTQKMDPEHARMATTIAGLFLNGDDYIVFNVGDSKVYRYRPPYIAQLSTDHSLVQDLKELGIDPKPGQEHVITRCLGGANAEPEIIDGKGRAIAGDVYLICSDGISDVFAYSELEDILAQDIPDKDLCWVLIEAAMSKGSKDNLSVIIARRID